MIPRPLVIAIVVVLTLLLAADIGAQFIVSGHTASPVIDGGILAILGGCVAASRGPQPNGGDAPIAAPTAPPPPTLPDQASADFIEPGGDGRHRAHGGAP